MTEPPDDASASPWTPAPPGSFGRLSGKLRARSRRRLFLGSAAAALTGAAAAGAWLIWWSRTERVYDYGGILCPEVVRLGPEYARGELDNALTEKIRIHVSRCPNCGPYYRSHGWPT